jgi:probable HAF family extracellular repeat protein
MLRNILWSLSSASLIALGACADAADPAGTSQLPVDPASGESIVSSTANSVTRIVGNWQVTITDLGMLPGGTYSSAYDINNIGEIVGKATDAGGVTRRVIWQNGVIVDTLPQPSSAVTTATQLNENRQLVGFANQGSGGIGYGVFWDHGTALKLQPLPGTVASGAAANGINAFGEVAGGGTGGGGGVPTYQHAALWRNGLLYQDLGVIPGGNFSMAYDINDARQVTGTGTAGGTGARQYAFVWANGVFTVLPDLPGPFLQSVGRSINTRGDVAGQSNGGDPVVWKNGMVQALPLPVRQANTSGSIGVLWKQGQYIPLDPWPGASVNNSVARGINNQGVVVGESYFPPGQGVHAVMWTVVPVGGGNLPPVAAWTVSCQPAPAHVCTFNGTGSRDPDGTVVGYKWTNAAGGTLSTLATFTRTFPSGGKRTWTLTVTDNGGATGKLAKTFTVP